MKNVGSIDRIVRIVIGLGLLSLLLILSGPIRYIGLVGLVPIFTASLGFCPLYTLFGMRTCPASPSRADPDRT